MIAFVVAHLAIIWTVWLCSFVAIFALFETIALMNHGLSLSMFVWKASEAWPPLIWICGVLAGGLAVHFWWHWNPPGSGLTGTGG